MNSEFQSARDDLAFLRGLMGEASESPQLRALGEAYFAGGLIYGGQMLLHAAQGFGLIPAAGPAALAVSVGPTILFIPVITWISLRARNSGNPSLLWRSIGRMFAVVGFSNLMLIAIIAAVALRERSLTTWLIYPCTAFVLQGAAWMFVFMMRRHAWHGLVAFGWFASALGMGIAIRNPALYVLFGGLGLWLCMALPGYAMLRSGHSAG